MTATKTEPDLRAAWSLQAIAGVLYLLSSAASVIPVGDLERYRPLNGLVGSGNFALAVFFTAFAYAMTRLLTADPHASIARLLRAWISLLAPALVAMALLTVAVAGVTRYDSTDVTSNELTRTALLHAWSFTENVWVLDNILLARSDVSSLWVVSLLVQYSVVLGVVAVALRRKPLVLALVALLAATSAIVWRVHVLDDQSWIYAALDSMGRADGFALGVAAAAVHGRARLSSETSAELFGGATLILGAGVLVTPFLDVVGIFGTLISVAAALTALALWCGSAEPDPRGLAVSTLSRSRLAEAGRSALPMLVWSPFFAATVTRHAEGGSPIALALVAAAGALVAAVGTRRLIDRGPDWARQRWADYRSREDEDVSEDHTDEPTSSSRR